jgi:hypothetical protein
MQFTPILGAVIPQVFDSMRYGNGISRGVRTAGGSAVVKSRWRPVGHYDDFTDNSVALRVAFRSGNFGAICIFDGGIHRRFRSPHYDFLAGDALGGLRGAGGRARSSFFFYDGG